MTWLFLDKSCVWYCSGFTQDDFVGRIIGGSLKAEEFTLKYYDSLKKKKVKEKNTRYIIEVLADKK
tara:strand:+ start:222 stop:419 length:198 start_codon:yes stop_codon:yes gene_type:complete